MLAVATFAAIVFMTNVFAEEAYRFKSPDGRHLLIVYRRPRPYAMPGQGSDAPGYVVLVNKRGAVLQRREVGMVQLVYKPRWTPTRVKVKLMFDWPLPKPSPVQK